MFATAKRMYQAFTIPEQPAKSPNAIKFGMMGAANISGMALFMPAKSHAECVMYAVAARDKARATEYAKKNDIPVVHDSYADLIADPEIDCIYCPLPNSYHFEWAAKAIKAGKHVLLEKPAVNNAEEAAALFNMPELKGPNAPVLMEAVHTRFHPSFVKFISLIPKEDVVSVHTSSMIPWWFTNEKDIYFNYKLGGGAIMSIGTYNFAIMRDVFRCEPEECVSIDTKSFEGEEFKKSDYAFDATFSFPGGRVGQADVSMQGPTIWKPSTCRVQLRPVAVEDADLDSHQEKIRTRHLTLTGFLHAVVYNKIEIHDKFEIRDKHTGKVESTWETRSSSNHYSFANAGPGLEGRPGKDHWMSFRYELEQFVNKIKGRPTTLFIDGEHSVKQMQMIDMAYNKAGMGPRPTSEYVKTLKAEAATATQ